ncbi:hypothetical protein JVT61DRAFT_7708 [Boletus reticuloceps]|uniref:Uncharacterized protein n=1 Tax=Boletus reticuloceps TaxID=495285 RepID=A0A8I2YHW0_9AGAM|nr:hypothetical protein JVT61DRAFT_7708 [Boletus reticuloceps]
MYTSRCMGGITRPRDLRVITRFRGGHLNRLEVDSYLSSDTDTLPVFHTRSGPQFSQQTRGFHSSSSHPYDSTSYNVTDVPDFFVKYKQHRATSSAGSEVNARKHEIGLMQSVADSTLSGDVVATTRRLKAKIPVEHHAAEGHVIHSSGFVVPGPGHSSTSDVARAKEKERNDKKDRLIQTAAVAHRVLESDFEQVNATTHPSSHKVPFEVREADGTIKHPSGFVPPTPVNKFRYSAYSSVLWDRKVSVVQRTVTQRSPSRAVLRAMHTNASVDV